MSISKQALKQYLTALGLVSDLWNGSTMDPMEADQGAGDVLQPIFLTRLEDVNRRRRSGCSSHVCTSPDNAWFRKEAEKDEPKKPRNCHVLMQLGAHSRAGL